MLGDRASRESIRTGASKASVEATFLLEPDSPAKDWLKAHELDDGEELILYRELSLSGRNVCRINGTLVSASELKNIGMLLVDLHGQHAHQSLLDNTTHIRLIDAYFGDSDGLAAETEAAREDALRLQKELSLLKTSVAERMQRIDMLQFQKNEIDRAALVSGEEEEMETRRNVLRNAEQIMDGLNTAYDALFGDGGVLSSLSDAREALQEIGPYDAGYRDLSQRTDDSYYTLEDVAYSLRDAKKDFVFDPDELESIESRLAMLQNLKRKYGATVDEILSYRDRIAEELHLLTDFDNQLETKETAYQDALQRFHTAAEKLSARRKKTAQKLCEAAVRQMKDMGMPHAQFETSFMPIPYTELSENGVDAVEFLLSANRGEPVKPLTKVASGGEISRIMLAMKIALSDADRIGTLIFDEIDTGISGMVANAVAKKMRELSKRHQILCVTHLPQIAAHADVQYVASKVSDAYSTRSSTRRLSEAERAQELARIMGSGMEDTAALNHAQKLLLEAKSD